jgi:hypothetical protein
MTNIVIEPAFEWVEVAHGWISFRLVGGSGAYFCEVADTNDVPSELLNAVTSIVRGSVFETVSFDLEPSEARWVFIRTDSQIVATLKTYDRWGSETGGSQGWTGQWDDPVVFGTLFLSATQYFLEKLGQDAYMRGWMAYPAPTFACDKLRRSLDGLAK